ncbi:hypothetical protein [Natronorubrum texcoconense]|uniref:Uncharacterized protein n=1 Tax=Natronorubrum texcoconense TaxID=1095776 RepID=A0A1G8U4G4_9EURY|nr:hypothetical protein [Natronorubrum texcoconense]SDJ47985.1 hypothetical protein SAMN04515672_0708 [Natronorubrum texcoconense]
MSESESQSPSELEFAERMQRADRWSKWIAMALTFGFFFVTMVLTNNVEFSAVVAAALGIGVRFVIPYRVTLSRPADEREPLVGDQGSPQFHHGAAGGALIFSSVAAAVVMVGSGNSTPGLVAGGIGLAVSYVAFSKAFPRA